MKRNGLPGILILILILVLNVPLLMTASLLLEWFLDRRKRTANLPVLMDDLKNRRGKLDKVIPKFGLTNRQIRALLEILRHQVFM